MLSLNIKLLLKAALEVDWLVYRLLGSDWDTECRTHQSSLTSSRDRTWLLKPISL